MDLNLGNGLRSLGKNIFDNARKENIGITEKEKEKSNSSTATKTASQYSLTTYWDEVTDMNLKHTSKTGNVLIMFSAWIAPFSSDETGDEIELKLQKDGVDVEATKRVQEIYPDAGEAEDQFLIIGQSCAINHLDKKADYNTWRIVAKSYQSAGNSFINDRELIVMDI